MSSQSRRVETLDFFGEQPAMSLYLLHRAELIGGEVRGGALKGASTVFTLFLQVCYGAHAPQ